MHMNILKHINHNDFQNLQTFLDGNKLLCYTYRFTNFTQFMLIMLIIQSAIRQLKYGKSTGPGRIPAEAIKTDKKMAIYMLYDLLGKI